MILFDTDHLTVFKYRTGDRAQRLNARVATATADGSRLGTTIVNVEEQMRGWLTVLAKEQKPHRQIGPYRDLAGLFDFFRAFDLALFTEPAADLFASYSAIRIKARDRKIAAIAVSNNALLLTANKRDFEQVPGLRFENWLDG